MFFLMKIYRWICLCHRIFDKYHTSFCKLHCEWSFHVMSQNFEDIKKISSISHSYLVIYRNLPKCTGQLTSSKYLHKKSIYQISTIKKTRKRQTLKFISYFKYGDKSTHKFGPIPLELPTNATCTLQIFRIPNSSCMLFRTIFMIDNFSPCPRKNIFTFPTG